jgi:hypothetical protein
MRHLTIGGRVFAGEPTVVATRDHGAERYGDGKMGKRSVGVLAALVGMFVAGSFHSAFGDEFQELWRTTYYIHGGAVTRPFDMVVTEEGRIYLTAGYPGSIYYPATGQVVAFDTLGGFRWDSPVTNDGGSPITISIDAEENTYTASTYDPEVLPLPGSVYFQKHLANSQLAWTQSGPTLDSNHAMGALASDGRFVVAYTGRYQDDTRAVHTDQLTLAGFAPDGAREWVHLRSLDFTTASEQPLAVLPARDGTFHVVGAADYTEQTESKDILIGKYSSAGLLHWTGYYSHADLNHFTAAAVDDEGNDDDSDDDSGCGC